MPDVHLRDDARRYVVEALKATAPEWVSIDVLAENYGPPKPNKVADIRGEVREEEGGGNPASFDAKLWLIYRAIDDINFANHTAHDVIEYDEGGDCRLADGVDPDTLQIDGEHPAPEPATVERRTVVRDPAPEPTTVGPIPPDEQAQIDEHLRENREKIRPQLPGQLLTSAQKQARFLEQAHQTLTGLADEFERQCSPSQLELEPEQATRLARPLMEQADRLHAAVLRLGEYTAAVFLASGQDA